MADSDYGHPNVGYKRVIIIAVVSTTFAVIADHLGLINAIEDMVNRWLRMAE